MRIAFLVLSFLLVWSCSKSPLAPNIMPASVEIEDLLPPVTSYDDGVLQEFAPSLPEEGTALKEMTVRLGDTLWSLSQWHGMAVDELISLNELEPPYRIYEGDILLVPHKDKQLSPSSSNSSSGRYQVTTGDTLYSIARRHNVSLEALLRANTMQEGTILHERDELVIPSAGEQFMSQLPPSSMGFVFPVDELLKPQLFPDGDDGMEIITRKGAAVRAIDGGTVVYVGNEVEGYGNLLLISHHGGWVSAYGYNEEILVATDDSVARGQMVARAGQSGQSDVAELYFELRRYNRVVNPRPYLEAAP